MELKQLIIFNKIAELEHMTKAAAELGLAEPFVSKKLSELEEELGVILFDRIGRGISLSLSGKALYERTMKIFNEIEDAVKEARAVGRMQQMKLTIATNVNQYMPNLLKLIVESAPEIKIEQLSAKRQNIISLIKNGKADFALCSPPVNNDPELESLFLRHETGVIIFPEGHPLKGRKQIALADLVDEPFITAAKGYGAREAFEHGFALLGLTPQILIETGDTISVCRYVENGVGIAAVPITIALTEPSFKNSYTEPEREWSGDVALIWRKKRFIGEAGKIFIEKTKEYFFSLEEFVKQNKIVFAEDSTLS